MTSMEITDNMNKMIVENEKEKNVIVDDGVVVEGEVVKRIQKEKEIKKDEGASIDMSLLTSRRRNDEQVKALSRMIIECLQTRGALSLDTLASILIADKKDVQNVLDCLVTTPLICMRRKNEAEETLYQYREGRPLADSVNLSRLSEIKAKEQREVSRCAQRIRALKAELERDFPDSSKRAKELFYRLITNHPSLKSDPLYKHISRVIFPP